MPRIKLTLEYDGTGYYGWQKQPTLPTIQQTLEETASRIAKNPIRIIGAGRTDAGVHAKGQVAHFDTDSPMHASMWQRALNRLLPSDITVIKAEEVTEKFHARYSAISKCYQYTILNRPFSSPLHRHQSWNLYTPLNLSKMQQGARTLLGTHDFKPFCATACTAQRTTLTLKRLDIQKKGEFILVTFEAQSFLMHMVRNLVGCLVALGQGRLTPKELTAILQGSRLLQNRTAPPHGLCLIKVKYHQ